MGSQATESLYSTPKWRADPSVDRAPVVEGSREGPADTNVVGISSLDRELRGISKENEYVRLKLADIGDFMIGEGGTVLRLEPLGLRVIDLIVDVKPSRMVERGVERLRNESNEGET